VKKKHGGGESVLFYSDIGGGSSGLFKNDT
jgi:hypothetical protein